MESLNCDEVSLLGMATTADASGTPLKADTLRWQWTVGDV